MGHSLLLLLLLHLSHPIESRPPLPAPSLTALHMEGMMAPPSPGLQASVCVDLQERHCTVMLVALSCGPEAGEEPQGQVRPHGRSAHGIWPSMQCPGSCSDGQACSALAHAAHGHLGLGGRGDDASERHQLTDPGSLRTRLNKVSQG